MVGATRLRAVSQSNAGNCGNGRPRGNSPNLLPMVSTGSFSAHTTSEDSTSTTTVEGSFAVMPRQRGPFAFAGTGQKMIRPSDTAPIASARQLKVCMYSVMTEICEKKFDGDLGIARPSRSFTCEMAMMTAMPAVKPITIDTGMKRTRLPRRNAPIANRSTPAIMVAIKRLATPYFSAMLYSRATKAPAGPPICTFDPPNAEIRKPATMAVTMPCSGRTPEAIPKAIASGRATMATVMPDARSCVKSSRL